MSSPLPYRNSQELMCEHFRYVSRSVGLLKRESSLRKVVDRSASCGTIEHMMRTDRPPAFSGKIGRIWKVARSLEIFAYGGTDRKIGPCPSSAARSTPTTIIPHRGWLVNRQFIQKKESFSALFHDTVNDIEDGKLFVTVEAGTEFLNVFPASSAGIIHFILFTSAVRAFNFHRSHPPRTRKVRAS